MNESKILNEWLEEIKNEMKQKFTDHNDKYKENSVTIPTFDFNNQLADEEYLRLEIHYHYAKWLYRGMYKKDIPEQDTLINLINMCSLLWIKLSLKKTNCKSCENYKNIIEQYPLDKFLYRRYINHIRNEHPKLDLNGIEEMNQENAELTEMRHKER